MTDDAADAADEANELDDLDRELLNAVQWDFPLVARPFAELAERLGVGEPEVRARVAKVKATGVLRQLSAIFDTRALGYSSSISGKTSATYRNALRSSPMSTNAASIPASTFETLHL